ncbi:MAG: nucleoside-diphosphate kinase, partial [Anaerolineaceae bacterium]
HYAIHLGKPFYDGLIKRITSSPVLVLAWEGYQVVAAIRQTNGDTNPLKAAPGTVRHDLGMMSEYNLIHASDSPENGELEVAIWFKPEELVNWQYDSDRWVYV